MKKLVLMLVLLVSLGCLVLVMTYGRNQQKRNDDKSPTVSEAAGDSNSDEDDLSSLVNPTPEVPKAGAEDDLELVGDLTGSDGENPAGDAPKKTNKVIVLDPGHGGKRTGAVYFGVMEKDVTLKVANYCRAYLLNNYENVEVYLTREEDIATDPDIKVELEQRVIYAKEMDADVVVSLHFNSMESHLGRGAEVYCSRRENIKDATFELGEDVMAELVKLGITRRGVLSKKSNDMFDETGDPYDYYAINRHCSTYGIPGIIIEHCFMDNKEDAEFMSTEEALAELAAADARGIAKYLGLKKKSE